ncbi:hypothetical protein Avbf_14982 [Armadillidium vulgare]|nr:hypothetical protein Avbf_14982 [Armadillidium vulgare]
MIALECHKKSNHAAISATYNLLRQEFWIPQIKQLKFSPDNNNLDIDTTHQIEKPGHSNNVPDDKKSVVVESQPKRSLDKKLDQQIKRSPKLGPSPKKINWNIEPI